MDRLVETPVLELRARLAGGTLDATTLATAFLAEIEAREPEVQAFAWLDREDVLEQARDLDTRRRGAGPIGALHGLPVAIKDTIDTAGIPTENGTPIDAGRVPVADAEVVRRLRDAGAIILGKTVTSELALFTPGKTRNPHDLSRSPGGSSSGSAAAVAARMASLAIGTQTAGSVIRPAAYCGVVGFKPSFGLIPRTGILTQAPSLDTVGVFALRPEEAGLLVDVLAGADGEDPATSGAGSSRLMETALSEPSRPPRIAFVPPPEWHSADAEMRSAFADLVRRLGPELCGTAELPEAFREANSTRECVQLAELAWSLADYERRGRDQLSPGMQAAFDRGKSISAPDYLAALDQRSSYNVALAAIFDRFDAILTPAATGPAPDLSSTGSPVFNGLWTLCGTPAVTLPLLRSDAGMPIGVQLVGRWGDDGGLLRTASWLSRHLGA